MKVLVVEDEAGISSFIKKGLEESGFQVDQAFDGNMAIRLASQNVYDIILLDIILPGLNGTEICKKLRTEMDFKNPIIMLTALSSTDDIVEGLDLGADDYLTKPFKFKELMARINALMRRKQVDYSTAIYKVKDLTVDFDKKEVFRQEQPIKLTAREFNLLMYLIKNKNRVVSRVDILENVWDVNFDMGTNVIDVYINYLRNKIDKKFNDKLLHTVVGMGYVLKDTD